MRPLILKYLRETTTVKMSLTNTAHNQSEVPRRSCLDIMILG